MDANQVNRRNFLKLSATAGAGLVFAPVKNYAEELPVTTKIPFRTLGRTGIQIPILSMGLFVGKPEVVKAAYNSGVRYFDTAHTYQNGRSEEILGDFLVDKPRASYVVGTKIYVGKDDTAQKFLERFEISLKRLKMEYVDILYRHDVRDAATVNQKPILDAMVQLQKEGKARHLGVSTHSNEPEVINAIADNEHYDVVLTAYNFSQKHLDELDPAIERAAKAGVGIVGMKTLAGNYLNLAPQARDSKAAIKWVLQNPNVHTIIPGYTSFDQLDECLEAVAHLEMTEEEKQSLTTIAADNSLYCQGCKACIPQCPEKLPIPDMMRAYMYHYGYRQPASAKAVVMDLALPDNPCGNCTHCSVSCTSGFQVANKIKDIVRLQHIPNDFLV